MYREQVEIVKKEPIETGAETGEEVLCDIEDSFGANESDLNQEFKVIIER